MIWLVQRGYDQRELESIPFPTVYALYQTVVQQQAGDQAENLQLAATAAQGTAKGIKKAVQQLGRIAQPNASPDFSGLEALSKKVNG